MASLIESGITLDFPTTDWFRFEKKEPYASLSGYGFKEMDACWCTTESGDNVIYAIELKDYSAVNALEPDNVESRKYDIVKKCVDSLQMLLAARYQTDFGKKLEVEHNHNMHALPIRWKLITIVNIPAEKASMMQALKDKCLALLKPYQCVWENVSVHILTYEQAKKHFLTFVK